ncbi:MAG: hypothetical protein QF685_07285 [Verrucomicrobiota bacterium]|nr:hypothetical protein [Verrucomicrobiota bacterium]
MKKLILTLIAIALPLCLVSCGNDHGHDGHKHDDHDGHKHDDHEH